MGQLGSKKGPSREDVAYLLSSTSFSEQAIVGWHKVFRRNTNSGFLTQTQFLALYARFFPKSEAGEYVNHIFRAYGKIRGNEWQLGFREYVLAIHESKAGSEEERLKRAFLIFDVERRGVIVEKDVADVYKSTGALLDPEREARKLFLRLDPLGQGGGVGEDQFLSALLQEDQNTPKAGRTKTASNRLKMAKPD